MGREFTLRYGGPVLGILLSLCLLAAATGSSSVSLLTARTLPQVGVVPAFECISNASPYDSATFRLTKEDATRVRGFSVSFRLNSHLTLRGGLDGIHEGPYLSGSCGPNCTHFERLHNPDGSFTVDGVILGLPCGPTGGGDLFSIDLERGASDGAGTITLTSVVMRDCDNGSIEVEPGPAATIQVETIPPPPVTLLTASQSRSGNDTDGTTKILVTFAKPQDATAFEVYRAGFGHYPEYDDAGGTIPQLPPYPPSTPWTLTTITDSGQFDEPAERDFWYYVAFAKDGCGNVSPVSGMTEGTLSYHLGDVSTGSELCRGDNAVGGVDVSLLGYHYGIPVENGFEYLDVGPTTDYSVLSRPLTDNLIDYEDLMMFAMNFEQVSYRGVGPTLVSLGGGPGRGAASLSVSSIPSSPRAGEAVEVSLVLHAGNARVQGIRTMAEYDPSALAYEASEVSDPIASRLHFFKALTSPGKANLSLAMLGAGSAIEGEGVVMTVRFRAVRDGATSVRFTETSLRDTTGKPLEAMKARDASQEPRP